MADDEIDIGRVVERALALKEADEIQERLVTIREAERTLGAQIKGEDPRASAIAIAGEVGIPQAYAERALKQLYPDEKRITQLELTCGVEEDFDSRLKRVTLSLNRFLRDLSESLVSFFPELYVETSLNLSSITKAPHTLREPTTFDHILRGDGHLYQRYHLECYNNCFDWCGFGYGHPGSGRFTADEHIAAYLLISLPHPELSTLGQSALSSRTIPSLLRRVSWRFFGNLETKPTIPTGIICSPIIGMGLHVTTPYSRYTRQTENDVPNLPTAHITVYHPGVLEPLAKVIESYKELVSFTVKKNY